MKNLFCVFFFFVYNNIRKWYETLRDEGCLCISHRPGRPGPSQYLWGFVKDAIFVPRVPANLQELRDRITAAVALIDPDMVTRVWNELSVRCLPYQSKWTH